MSKFDDVMDKCEAQLREQKMRPDRELLDAIGKSLGPSLYKKDALLVAAGQKSELETIKKNFLIKKLGLKDGPELMAALNAVIETYGKSERNKYRAVVYYMLVKHFGKESVYG